MKSKPSALSIVIPTYKYDCFHLVEELARQADELGIVYEILLGDDLSGKEWADKYDSWTEKIPHLKVYHAFQNLGAGKMRNRLVEQASWDTILILDSDVLPLRSNFLKSYLLALEPYTVVCGGFTYDAKEVSPERLLRYVYGTKIESRDVDERKRDPYRSFIAMSMLATRSVLDIVSYPPEMGMGYEDARFGHILKLAKIPIKHIDNPVVHKLKETSEEFLATTRKYVNNLYRHRVTLSSSGIHLLDTFNKVKKSGLVPLFKANWKLLHRCMEKQLCSKKPSMTIFSLYKLLYICSLHKSRTAKQLN